LSCWAYNLNLRQSQLGGCNPSDFRNVLCALAFTLYTNPHFKNFVADTKKKYYYCLPVGRLAREKGRRSLQRGGGGRYWVSKDDCAGKSACFPALSLGWGWGFGVWVGLQAFFIIPRTLFPPDRRKKLYCFKEII